MATPQAPPPKAPLVRPASARPIPSNAFRSFSPPAAAYTDQQMGLVGEVAQFDPVARAALIASQMPRLWGGDYQPFDNPGRVLPVQLSLSSVVPAGQMVVIRGDIRIGDVTTPVQGNLNAKSDQFDMLLTGDRVGGDIEAGAEFMGLQGLSLSGLRGPRLITMGGRLQLVPARPVKPQAAPGPVIRGLW